MVSRKTVATAIDGAHEKLRWCWNALAGLRTSPGESDTIATDIVSFQRHLIEALWLLDDEYRKIVQEKLRVIKRKKFYNDKVFVRRLARLDFYRATIKGTIGIAKSLGDAFAWLFYSSDLDLVDKHLACQLQVNLPPGVGRIGERVLVERFQGFNGHLILYHGISTFLRLGDVSFIDLERWKVASIAELKTKRNEGHNYTLTMSCVYGEQFRPPIPPTNVALGNRIEDTLTPQTREKLKRQTKAISAALSERKQSNQTHAFAGDYYFDELSSLISNCSGSQFGFEAASKSMLMVGIKVRGQKLSTRMLSSKKLEYESKLDGVTDKVKEIVDENLKDNAVFVSTLGYGKGGFPVVLKGSLPLFWWPLAMNHLHALVFGEVVVLTLHNPAHFWQALRAKGYTVETDNRSRLIRATKKLDDKLVRLENLDHFRHLTERFLMSEQTILRMFEKFVEMAQSQPNARIDLSPQMMVPGFPIERRKVVAALS